MSSSTVPADPPPPPRLTLDGDGGIPWRAVSPELVGVRQTALLLVGVPLGLAAGGLLVLVGAPEVLALTLLALVGTVLAAVGWVFVPRQVAAIGYAELPDEVAIRGGRLRRTLVTIPYGRIQYVDMTAGPLLRRSGLASVEVHTANPASAGTIPGLPVGDAELLRARLSRLGESRRAGL